MKQLKDLVVGDKVIVTLQQFTITKVFVGKVERLTKTLIIVNGIKFVEVMEEESLILMDIAILKLHQKTRLRR